MGNAIISGRAALSVLRLPSLSLRMSCSRRCVVQEAKLLSGRLYRSISAILHRDGRARPETKGPGDLPRRPSTVVHLFGRSAALGDDAGALPRYSVYSKIARAQRKHNAKPLSCLARCPTDPCASRVDRLADRRCSKSPDPRLALGMEPAALGMLLVDPFCDSARYLPDHHHRHCRGI